MSKIKRLTIIESLWSLGNLIKENLGIIAAGLVASGAAMRAFWKYIEFAADLEGPWVYPVTILLLLGAGIALVATGRWVWRQFSPDTSSEASPSTATIDDEYDPRLYSEDPENEALDKVAYNDIMAFTIDVLLPACEKLSRLETIVITEQCPSEEIAQLAVSGAYQQAEWHHRTRDFIKFYHRLSGGLTASPGPVIKFDGMIDCIFELEKGFYAQYHVWVVERMAKAEVNTTGGQQRGWDAWEEWRVCHNKLVTAYETIKRDSRFGKLLRPVRPSRWGDVIDPLPAGEALPFLLVRDNHCD